jgi:hypothetical protein
MPGGAPPRPSRVGELPGRAQAAFARWRRRRSRRAVGPARGCMPTAHSGDGPEGEIHVFPLAAPGTTARSDRAWPSRGACRRATSGSPRTCRARRPRSTTACLRGDPAGRPAQERVPRDALRTSLRNPLAPIRAALQPARRDDFDAVRARALLETMDRQVTQMTAAGRGPARHLSHHARIIESSGPSRSTSATRCARGWKSCARPLEAGRHPASR